MPIIVLIQYYFSTLLQCVYTVTAAFVIRWQQDKLVHGGGCMRRGGRGTEKLVEGTCTHAAFAHTLGHMPSSILNAAQETA